MTNTSADSVSVISQHTIRCANETSWAALDSPFRLGPLDQGVAPFIPIAVVFVYEQSTSNPDVELIPAEHLQRSLSLLLDHYPHLTGRLQINSGDGTPELTRLGTGAEFLVARCSERLDAFTSPGNSPGRILSLPGAGNALLAPFDVTSIYHNPLFTVQHTRFACGSVALGVRVYHKVCDADGFFQLVQDLAELYRGVRSFEKNEGPTSSSPSLAHPPHIRSYMSELNGDNTTPGERLEALEYQPAQLYIESPSTNIDVEDHAADNFISSPSTVTTSHPPPVVGRFLRFSSRELNTLKAHATDPNASSDDWISTFEALSAHLCQRVHRARLKLHAKDPNHGTLSSPNFLTPVNLRSRLGNDFPSRYFPNALWLAYTDLPLASDVLSNGPLWQVAKSLHNMTRTPSRSSKEEINRNLKWMAFQPDKGKIRDRFQYGNGTLMISQWNKFDMYAGTVFDVPPVLVSPPFTPISLVDGLGYLVPTEERGTGGDTGAIDVSLALSEPLWAIFDKDQPQLL